MRDRLMGTRFLRAVGMSVLVALVLCAPARGQQAGQTALVSGKVTTQTGAPIQGVTVRIRGTTTTTLTDADGKYSITAPTDGILLFGLIGYRGLGQSVTGRTTINAVLEPAIAVLPDVVVTGYTEQKRRDLLGSVSIVNVESATKQTTTSVLQGLDGRVPGVTVDNSGSPGSRSTVRIRGVSSFQNNDPVYIVDGTPLQDSYLNWLNPNDIGSIQVLKDASSASIYGSRAGNGVVIIETKRGRAGGRSMTLDVRTGVAMPVRGYDDILTLNSLDYFKVVRTAYQNAGLKTPTNIYGDSLNPQVPAYIWPNNCTPNPCSNLDLSTYSYPGTLIMPGSAGTNWWKAVFGSGQYRDANLAVSGGGEDNTYHMSFNFLDQQGTAAFNRLQRGGVRVNTAFNVGRASVGENITVSRQRSYGGIDDGDLGEGNIIGKNIFQQPVVPIYDIAGNFASGKAVGLSNLTNPLKIATASRNNISTNDRIFGNVFGGFDARNVSLKTRLGFNLSQG